MFSMCLCVLYFFTTKRCTELAEVAQSSQSSQKCIKTMFPMCHFDKLSASLCFLQNSKLKIPCYTRYNWKQ